jgi:hypothetical protein
MKRQTSQQLSARRCEAANLVHKGWTQAPIASHLKSEQENPTAPGGADGAPAGQDKEPSV